MSSAEVTAGAGDPSDGRAAPQRNVFRFMLNQLSGMRIVFGTGTHERKLTLTFGFLSSLLASVVVLTLLWAVTVGIVEAFSQPALLTPPASFGDGTQTGWIVANFVVARGVVVINWLMLLLLYAGEASGTALLVLIAVACIGALLGFLFGVPRPLSELGSGAATQALPQNPPPLSSTPLAPPSGLPTPTSGVRAVTANLPSWHANTNLTQVSDWLTKIIVGLGLVEANRIGKFVSGVHAYVVAALLPDAKVGTALIVAALMIAGLILGFMYSYLFTQLFLAGMMAQAAEAMLQNKSLFAMEPDASVEMQRIRPASHVLALPISMPDSGAPVRPESTPTPEQKRAATRILSVSLSEIEDPQSVYVWARACAVLDLWEPAAAGYAKLLETRRTPQVLLEAARVFAAKQDIETASALIGEALAKRAHAGPKLRARIVFDAAYMALYEEPPEGYRRALSLLTQEVLASDPSGGLHVLRACADGQRYTYEAKDLTDSAKTAIEQGIVGDLRAGWSNPENRNWIRYLLGRNPDDTPRSPAQEAEDDDLFPFRDAPGIIAIVGPQAPQRP